ncbi:GNAT family N-acetyltransferase [Rhodoligotrophos defluvii]|uniref:GNAT family N-acetyltransferase n=1 Tax=Rhodoligotrophos defluvii TaxID=2561934 RepID=UPI0010C9D194|nr:N-acetyltransferase [Rhodoligotrophos defluvii]
MIIRDQRNADGAAVHDVVTAAFRGQPYSSGHEPFIADALWRGGGAVLALVAEEDEQIIGQIAFSPVTIDNRESDWHCLGPVAVRPDRQRLGIGRSLIETGLARLREIGSGGCVLVGSPGYYQRFGFRAAPQLHAPEVPADYLLALSFGPVMPRGLVSFHAAFSATGPVG